MLSTHTQPWELTISMRKLSEGMTTEEISRFLDESNQKEKG